MKNKVFILKSFARSCANFHSSALISPSCLVAVGFATVGSVIIIFEKIDLLLVLTPETEQKL